uniref:Uncharacterized protein n=1 Tax=Amphimedon queenslandica TaxID=400682 RepID=A0A1X7UIN0_AMPQE
MESSDKNCTDNQEKEYKNDNNDDDDVHHMEGVNETTCLPLEQDSEEMKEAEKADSAKDTDVTNNSNSSVQGEQVLCMLNLMPRKRIREESQDTDVLEEWKAKQVKEDIGQTEGSNVTPPPAVSASPSKESNTHPSSLSQLFKKDPDFVLSLLSKAVSMDSLSLLLKTEHQNNAAQLKNLKEKVEKAHSVLSQCAGRREFLLKSVDEVTKDIQAKRSQLAATREELREMSMHEGQVKQKRDLASQKCLDLRKKVRACRDTVQQLQGLYGKKRKSSEKTFKTRTVET